MSHTELGVGIRTSEGTEVKGTFEVRSDACDAILGAVSRAEQSLSLLSQDEGDVVKLGEIHANMRVLLGSCARRCSEGCSGSSVIGWF